jgi:hypothetical protein
MIMYEMNKNYKNFMKQKNILIALLCIFVTQSFAQDQFKKERWIYIWDVTLSMHGFVSEKNAPAEAPEFYDIKSEYFSRKGAKLEKVIDGKGVRYVESLDLYDEVLSAILANIQTIPESENTEIVLIPFQGQVLDVKTVKATPEGKREILDYVRSYVNPTRSNTNIASPLQAAMDIIEEDCNTDIRNVVVRYTDGEHNVTTPSKQSYYNLLQRWCNTAEKNDARLFYVALTHYALDPELKNVLEESCIGFIPPGGGVEPFVDVLLPKEYTYNLKDELDLNTQSHILKIKATTKVVVPSDLKIIVFAEPNQYFTIEEKAYAIKEGYINVPVKFNAEPSQLADVIPASVKTYLSFEIENAEQHPFYVLLNNACSIEIKNVQEPSVFIYRNKK